ncbi:MAG: LysE family transporter [Hyphomicrobiales bacterium]
MPTLAFCLSLLALLFAPGPTNALLALAGAETGAARTLRLLPVVFAAYAITVLPLAALGEDLMRQQHMVRAGVTFVAALWVAWMAVALWRQPAPDAAADPGRGRALRMFITTLINPKAFIIGLVLIPAQASRGTALVLFFSVLAAAAVAWSLLGAALQTQRRLPLLRRVCAGWLGLLAVMLGSAALSA